MTHKGIAFVTPIDINKKTTKGSWVKIKSINIIDKGLSVEVQAGIYENQTREEAGDDELTSEGFRYTVGNLAPFNDPSTLLNLEAVGECMEKVIYENISIIDNVVPDQYKSTLGIDYSDSNIVVI